MAAGVGDAPLGPRRIRIRRQPVGQRTVADGTPTAGPDPRRIHATGLEGSVYLVVVPLGKIGRRSGRKLTQDLDSSQCLRRGHRRPAGVVEEPAPLTGDKFEEGAEETGFSPREAEYRLRPHEIVPSVGHWAHPIGAHPQQAHVDEAG